MRICLGFEIHFTLTSISGNLIVVNLCHWTNWKRSTHMRYNSLLRVLISNFVKLSYLLHAFMFLTISIS